MIDDFTAATPSLPSAWFPDEDHLIPYMTRFHAKQCRTLDTDDMRRWLSSPVVSL